MTGARLLPVPLSFPLPVPLSRPLPVPLSRPFAPRPYEHHRRDRQHQPGEGRHQDGRVQ